MVEVWGNNIYRDIIFLKGVYFVIFFHKGDSICVHPMTHPDFNIWPVNFIFGVSVCVKRFTFFYNNHAGDVMRFIFPQMMLPPGGSRKIHYITSKAWHHSYLKRTYQNRTNVRGWMGKVFEILPSSSSGVAAIVAEARGRLVSLLGKIVYSIMLMQNFKRKLYAVQLSDP